MSTPDPGAHPPASGSLAGCALFVVGLLLVVPSGLCTAAGGIALAMELVSNPGQLFDNLSAYSGFVVITLGCLAAGIAMIRSALRARRR